MEEERSPTVESSPPGSCSSSGPSSRSRFLLGERKSATRILGFAKNSASSTRMSPARSTRQESLDETETHQEKARRVPASKNRRSPARSTCREQGSPDEFEAYQEHEKASFTEVTRGKAGLRNPLELPHEFAALDDSILQAYHQGLCPQKNICPVTDQTVLCSSASAQNHGGISAKPNEIAVRWNGANSEEISVPLYAEVTCGRLISKSEPIREWDVRTIRKLRHLKVGEKETAMVEFSEHYKNYLEGKCKPKRPYQIALNKGSKVANLDSQSSEVHRLVLCPLCDQLIVDPVATATGTTFGRACIKKWFLDQGHVCPVTGESVSSVILRNYRIADYIAVWKEVVTIVGQRVRLDKS